MGEFVLGLAMGYGIGAVCEWRILRGYNCQCPPEERITGWRAVVCAALWPVNFWRMGD